LKDLSKEKVKEIALEIAQAGIHGIDPNQRWIYSSLILPGKKFGGSQLTCVVLCQLVDGYP
jgi:hypothetical protein